MEVRGQRVHPDFSGACLAQSLNFKYFFYRQHICPAWCFNKQLVFQWVQIVLANLFQHAYEADVLLGILKNEDRKLDQTFNYIFHIYVFLNKQLEDIDIYNVIENFEHTKVQTQ
jgi:hypothetical protein